MKLFNPKIVLLACFCVFLSLTGCDHDISVVTSVKDDGSIDRTIELYDVDSSKALQNIFNINQANGWETVITPVELPRREGKRKSTQKITFRKHFASVDDANQEMTGDADTIFHIRSSFEKKNGWFYTELEYSDTYLSLNRFRAIPQEEYFTREDYAFIERLPGEGKRISKADSLQLAMLNQKIFDVYGARTIFEELFNNMLTTMRKYQVDQKWEDSLFRKKEQIFQKFAQDGNNENDHIWTTAHILKMPLPPGAEEDFQEKAKKLERRIELLSDAYSGKFRHTITVPWTVANTNADSVVNNNLYWNPPVIKFLLQDYTMTARARKMNVWSVVTAAAVILMTLILFLARGSKMFRR